MSLKNSLKLITSFSILCALKNFSSFLLTPDYLQIQDSGIGIARDKLGEITQRYKRANRAKGGFGIGLSIVQTVCTTYHFKLEIDSSEHEGSTFTIKFSSL